MGDVFDALAHPVRRQILRAIRGAGEIAAGDLAAHVDVGKPTLSHHLVKLHEAGLVDRERRGSFVYYRLDQSILEEALQAVFDLLGTGTLAPAPEEER